MPGSQHHQHQMGPQHPQSQVRSQMGARTAMSNVDPARAAQHNRIIGEIQRKIEGKLRDTCTSLEQEIHELRRYYEALQKSGQLAGTTLVKQMIHERFMKLNQQQQRNGVMRPGSMGMANLPNAHVSRTPVSVATANITAPTQAKRTIPAIPAQLQRLTMTPAQLENLQQRARQNEMLKLQQRQRSQQVQRSAPSVTPAASMSNPMVQPLRQTDLTPQQIQHLQRVRGQSQNGVSPMAQSGGMATTGTTTPDAGAAAVRAALMNQKAAMAAAAMNAAAKNRALVQQQNHELLRQYQMLNPPQNPLYSSTSVVSNPAGQPSKPQSSTHHVVPNYALQTQPQNPPTSAYRPSNGPTHTDGTPARQPTTPVAQPPAAMVTPAANTAATPAPAVVDLPKNKRGFTAAQKRLYVGNVGYTLDVSSVVLRARRGSHLTRCNMRCVL